MPDDGSGERTDSRDWGEGRSRHGSEVTPREHTTGSERDRIPIDLSDDRSEQDSTPEDDDDVYAPEPSSAPVEAGEPTLEHAVFVLLGAIAMLLVVVRVVGLLG